MAKKVFPVKVDEEIKAAVQYAAVIKNMSTNALAEKLLADGANKIIQQHESK